MVGISVDLYSVRGGPVLCARILSAARLPPHPVDHDIILHHHALLFLPGRRDRDLHHIEILCDHHLLIAHLVRSHSALQAGPAEHQFPAHDVQMGVDSVLLL